jgi:hypothetical protein
VARWSKGEERAWLAGQKARRVRGASCGTMRVECPRSYSPPYPADTHARTDCSPMLLARKLAGGAGGPIEKSHFNSNTLAGGAGGRCGRCSWRRSRRRAATRRRWGGWASSWRACGCPSPHLLRRCRPAAATPTCDVAFCRSCPRRVRCSGALQVGFTAIT